MREYGRLVLPQIFPTWSKGDWRLLVLACSPMLVLTHLGVLALRILPPRPSLRRLARQPGFVAAAALATMVLLQTADAAYKWLAVHATFYRGPDPSSIWFHNYLQAVSPPMVAPTIVVAWVVLGFQQTRLERWD